MTATAAKPIAPLSWGELIDKITILEIKAERLTEAEALANVRSELAELKAVAVHALQDSAVAGMIATLKTINLALWEIEDRIRLKDAAGAFDAEFVALARSVYQTNDERAVMKRRISLALRSELVEEKSYTRSAFGF